MRLPVALQTPNPKPRTPGRHASSPHAVREEAKEGMPEGLGLQQRPYSWKPD